MEDSSVSLNDYDELLFPSRSQCFYPYLGVVGAVDKQSMVMPCMMMCIHSTFVVNGKG